MKKRILTATISVFMCLSTLSGCTGSQDSNNESLSKSDTKDSSKNDVTLEMFTAWTGEKKEILSDLISDFTTETGIKVELVSPGENYSTVMKTRMGSENLPDVWETHGWSVALYSEYLLALNDQPWISRVDESIIPVISDKDGNIYTTPLTMGINTISYSKDAFDKAGIKASDIRTWDDFESACEKLKEAGITPIYMGNKDGTSIAQLAEAVPPTYLTNSDIKDNQGDELKNGTFDFAKYWTPIAQRIAGWMEKGYFNVDILTSDNESGTKALGAGEAGMMFGGSNNITNARTFNPEANLGILPAPALNDSSKSSLSMGEGNCYGVWKDTEYKEEALQLMDFLTKKENVSILSTASGDLPGFTDVDNPDDYITKVFRETQASFKDDLVYVPLFDREYLPAGMWDDLGISLTEIITNPSDVSKSVSTLEAAYNQKINQE